MRKQSPHPLDDPGRTVKRAEPCIMVIFGATGDLTSRKLLPAIYGLKKDSLLPSHFAVVAFARREKTSDIFRREMKNAINKYVKESSVDSTLLQTLTGQLYYHQSNFNDDEGYKKLKKLLDDIDLQQGTKKNRIYYLATPPKYFPLIIEKLYENKLLHPTQKTSDKWSRIIIEKPFGHDFSSAKKLQEHITKYADESQIYRIDHYLGKETVQNLLVFRFANSIFEALWNANHINHVQITVAEEMGIGTRGHFFEEQGILRDVVQNHMMQLLSLVAMEPPINLDADSIRDEKVKILEALRPLDKRQCKSCVVRGQYTSGYINGESAVSYHKEKDVLDNSLVETFVALKVYIDNWRWAGVPFYLRTGKRLPKRATEIAIYFKDAPGVLFQKKGNKNQPNILTLRIQPDEGIAMRINTKVPGQMTTIQPVKMDFCYGSYFGRYSTEAYERLIFDALIADSTLFARQDEVAHSWKFITTILDSWKKTTSSEIPMYESGTWGPKAADEMIRKDGYKWRLL